MKSQANRRQLIEAVEVTDSGIHVVRLMKVFDASSVHELEKVLSYMMEKKHYKVVIDLTNVEFVSSAGWGAFTADLRRLRENNGDVRLAAMNPDVQDVFFLLELDSFIHAYNTVDDAIASFELAIPLPARAGREGIASLKSEGRLRKNKKAVTSEAAGSSRKAARKARVFDRLPEPVIAAPPPEVRHHDQTAVAETEPQESEWLANKLEAAPPLPVRTEPPGSALPVLARQPAKTEEDHEEWSAFEVEETEGPIVSVSEEEEIDVEQEGEFEHQAPALHLASSEAIIEEELDLPELGLDSPFDNLDEQPLELEPFPAAALSPGASRFLPESTSDESESEEEPEAPPLVLAPVSHDANSPAAVKPDRQALREAPAQNAEQELDEFELQDIHDPWILDEIDTLPEEDEMDDTGWEGELASEEDWAEPEISEDGGRSVIARESQIAVARPSSDDSPTLAPAMPTTENVPPVTSEPMLIDQAATPQESSNAVATPQPLQKNSLVAKIRLEGDRLAIVRRIVSDHPHYGPTMIQKFLETRLDPPIAVSRSTVYRWLRLTDLNTQEQRLAFAGKAATA